MPNFDAVALRLKIAIIGCFFKFIIFVMMLEMGKSISTRHCSYTQFHFHRKIA